jgi:hypothetical protein
MLEALIAARRFPKNTIGFPERIESRQGGTGVMRL